MQDDPRILTLGGKPFHSKQKVAEDRGVNPRTVDRLNVPSLTWGGKKYFEPGVVDRRILATRSKNPNASPRRRRIP